MGTELANLQEKIKSELQDIRRSVPAPTGRSISTKGKVFTMPNGRTSNGPIRAVILDHRNYNRYYNEPYDAKAPKPPACFAINKDISDLAPHEEASDPQCESCAECAMNKWGSAPTGKGKACRNTVRLAIAMPPDAENADEEPMILSVSPTALKSWSALVNDLESVGMLPVQVVTEIAFDQNQAFPTLLFKSEQPHDQLAKYWHMREKAQALLDQPPASD